MLTATTDLCELLVQSRKLLHQVVAGGHQGILWCECSVRDDSELEDREERVWDLILARLCQNRAMIQVVCSTYGCEKHMLGSGELVSQKVGESMVLLIEGEDRSVWYSEQEKPYGQRSLARLCDM
jgi:hypothetical protein